MRDEKVDEVIVTPPENPQKVSRFSWQQIGIMCSAFSLIVLILVGGYGAWYLIAANMQLAEATSQSQHALQQLQTDFANLQTSTQQTAQQSAEDIKNLKQTLADLTQDKQGNQEKWLLTEARHYAKFANDNLQFLHNIPLAIYLLKMADQQISHITDPKVADIRAAISSDMANLQAAPQVDIAGLYAKLVVINNQLDQLPLQAMQSNLQKPAVNVAQNQSMWQRGLHELGQGLRNIVIVRNNANGAMPLVTPEQKAFLYQNLHALVAQATWGLLHQQAQIYQSSLQQLNDWVKRYFVLDVTLTQTVLDNVSQLEKIDIHPPMLNLTNTLQAFNGV